MTTDAVRTNRTNQPQECATKHRAPTHAKIHHMRKRHGRARDRQLKAVEMHLAGHGYGVIAEKLNFRGEPGPA